MSIEKHNQEQISLSKDKKAQLDGWKWTTKINNKGIKNISELIVRIDFLDANGNVIEDASIEEVAIGHEQYKGRGIDLANDTRPKIVRQRPPLERGGARDFEYTTGNTPEGWSRRVNLSIEKVQFEK